MRMKRVALAAGLVLLALAGAFVAAVHLLAPRAAAMLAESVKASTGRELSFGEIRVSLLPLPALDLRQVRFGNAPWGSQPWLAQAGRVRVEIDLIALLAHDLHLRRVAVEDASVLLETDRDGNGNWATIFPDTPARTPASVRVLALDDISVQALTVSYRNGATGNAASVRLDALEFAGSSASQRMQLRAEASIEGTKITVTGSAGELPALIANVPAYPLDLDVRVGAGTVGVHGTIDKPRTPQAMNLALSAQAADLAGLARLVGAKFPPGPLRAAAQLSGTPAAPVFNAVDLDIGTAEAHLTAHGDVQAGISAGGEYAWRSTGVDLLVEGSQFGDLGDWIDQPLPALGKYRIAAHADGALAAPALSAIDATLGGDGLPEIAVSGAVTDIRAGNGIDLQVNAAVTHWWSVIGTALRSLPPFRASGRLRESKQGYLVDDLELKIIESRASASLRVDRVGSRLRVAGTVKSPLIDLSRAARSNGGVPAAAASGKSRTTTNFWKVADVDLDVDIARLVLPGGQELRARTGKIALLDGRLRTSALQTHFGGADVRIDGSIADPQNLAGIDLKIAVQGNELADLFTSLGNPIPRVGKYAAHAVLHESRETSATTAADARARRGYVLDDFVLDAGRSSVRGRITLASGEPRLRIAAKLQGPLLDLSALARTPQKRDDSNPLLAADVDADVRFDRIVLPDRRALGVTGGLSLAAGALKLNRLRVAVDGASAVADGTIAQPREFAGLALAMDVDVVDYAGIVAFFKRKDLADLPAFSASGRLSDVPNGYSLADLKLAFAAATMTGDAKLTRGAERPALWAKLSSPLLDLTALKQRTPETAAKPASAGARVIPDVALPVADLRAIDADLDVRIDKLKYSDAAPLGPVLARAVVAAGRLKVEPAQIADGAGGILRVSATADAAQAGWTLRVDGSGVELGALLARFGQPQLVSGGSAELELDVRGHGKSLQAVVGSLNGYVQVKIGPHRFNNVAVDMTSGIAARMLSAANPFQKTDPNTDVTCIAARLPLKDGVVSTGRHLGIETARYNLFTSGTVNLRTERFDLAITPIVTRGLGIGNISTTASLTGTFAAPSVGISAAGAIKSAASMGANVALPVVGNIAESLINKVTTDPHPCATALSAK